MITSIPDEILELVFSFLGTNMDCIRLLSIDKEMYSKKDRLTYLKYVSCSFPDFHVKLFQHSNSIRKINLEGIDNIDDWIYEYPEELWVKNWQGYIVIKPKSKVKTKRLYIDIGNQENLIIDNQMFDSCQIFKKKQRIYHSDGVIMETFKSNHPASL